MHKTPYASETLSIPSPGRLGFLRFKSWPKIKPKNFAQRQGNETKARILVGGQNPMFNGLGMFWVH